VQFCALPCAEGQCAEGYACTEDHCVSNPVFMKPGFGEACVGEGADPLLVGCVDGATCLVGESESYCTRACGFSSPCPAGYGCVEIAPDQPECRRGAVTDERFGPQAGTDGGPLAPPPPVGPTVAPTAAPSAGGGGGGRDSGGCSMTPPQGRHATLGLVALALGGATWRRRRATRRP
jgi:MYXO-CTERM domain-containing protein